MTTGNLGRTDVHADEQAGQLISGALSDARDLALAEVDKLKAEVLQQARGMGEEAKILSVAAVLLALSAVMLAGAIALGLTAAGLPSWLALGLVAVAYGGAGALFLKRA
jgi:hypothetical protein